MRSQRQHRCSSVGSFRRGVKGGGSVGRSRIDTIPWAAAEERLKAMQTATVETLLSQYQCGGVTQGLFYESARNTAYHRLGKEPETVQEIYRTLGLKANIALLVEMDRLAYIGRRYDQIERIARENLRNWGFKID